jgi:PAS domain S-box-containing protein
MFPKTTQFEKLLEAVPNALVGVDQKGVIRFVNRQTEVLFGYDRDQLIGEHIDTLVPEPLWQVYAEHRQDYFTDPRTRSLGLDLELSGRNQDGTDFPINITMSLIDTGDVLLVITGSGEVTRQKKAVAKAELLDAIVEYSDDAIMGLTLGGIITSWNPGAERMYGYSSMEMVGKPGSLLTPQDRTGELIPILDRIKDGRYVEHAETTLVRKDGTLVPVSIAAAPIRSEDGTIVGASAVHRDVTKQRQAFEAAQRMAAIVQSSDEAIVARTLDGTITSWNPAAARMFGYSSEEIIGRPITVLIPADRAGEVITHLAKVSVGRPVDTLETMRLRKDGTAFPAALTVSPIRDANDAVLGASVIYRDVSELRHAAQYARSLIETALDPLVTISAQGTITDVNEATVNATGVPRDTLIGTDFSGYFTDPDKAHEGYELVFAQGSVIDYPLTLRRSDGTQIDVLYNASLYHDANGNVLGVFAAARDVTTKKQMFEAAQRLASIVEGSDEAIIASTLDGVVTSWNPAAERMYGYCAAEIVGRSIQPVAPTDRLDEISDILEQVKVGRHVANLETERVRKDGSVFPVSLSVSPVRDAGGTIIGTSVICRELTEQRRALEVAQHLAAIVQNSGEAIVSGSLDGTITSWNPAAAAMFGYSSAEIVGKPATLLMPKDRTSDLRDIAGQIRAGRPVQGLETKRVRKNGSVFPVALSASPVRDADGTVTGASVIYRDLSEQKGALATAQRMAAIVESSEDAIITRTLDGTITSWNPAAARMFGYSSAQIVGKHVGLLIPQDRGAEMISVLAKISADQPVDDFETVRVRKDATVFPVALTISPLHNEHGAVTGASVIYRDLSKLRHAARYARSLIEAALDPMVTISPDGTITDTNEAAVKVTGVARNKLIGTDFSGYFTDPQQAHECYQRAFTQGSVTNYRLTLRRRDGAGTAMLYNASVYRDEGGAVLGVCAVARDLSRHEGPPTAGRPAGGTPPGTENDTLGP